MKAINIFGSESPQEFYLVPELQLGPEPGWGGVGGIHNTIYQEQTVNEAGTSGARRGVSHYM